MIRKLMVQLVLQEGLGPVVLARIFQQGIDPQIAAVLYDLSADDIAARYTVTNRHAFLIYTALRNQAAFDRHEEWCALHDVRVITLLDDEYSRLLRQIGAPPVVLWVRGALPPVGMSVCALVGSREATNYGKRIVKMIVPSLVAQGVATVSGGARGIDGWVHEETIAAGGHTTVVMGCGLAHAYPPEHKELFNRVVVAGGALLSPFPPDIEPQKGTFPARNRIIAGLAEVCMVVQAAARSGALITAAHALEENREVAAVPGQIDDPLAAGTNQLISQGARVVYDAASALELFGKRAMVAKIAVENMLSVGASRVLALLEKPVSLDELFESFEGSMAELQAFLFELRVAGKSIQNHAGMWVRCG